MKKILGCICGFLLCFNAAHGLDSASAVNIHDELLRIDSFLDDNNNIWYKKYSNYLLYRQVMNNISIAQAKKAQIEQELEQENNKKDPQKIQKLKNTLSNIERNLDTMTKKSELLNEFKDNPFKELIEPTPIPAPPVVSNPILAIGAFSYMKQNQSELGYLNRNYGLLEQNIIALRQKETLLQELFNYSNLQSLPSFTDSTKPLSKQEITDELEVNSLAIEEFSAAKNLFSTTLEIYSKNINEIHIRLSEQIKAQAIKLGYLGVIIFISFLLAFLIKLAIKKYINDNERIYTASKIINFLNLTLVILILLFAYLENVTYVVTVLGFASAGLAIAMKDLFMSILGWIVIVIGGAVHVGDRIRVQKDGATYVGDVLDISSLRITLLEDITLLTYTENRRAGRIIFIPNNFIFTTMFSNYTHGSMRTVWDGIDFTITFDSDHARAVVIARECAKKYAKGYTDITRKQLNKLRDRYSLRNTNVEPRVFSFLEPYGVRISVWYLTNAYATLALRSTISAEILDGILKEPHIKIAYPTTTVNDGISLAQKGGGAISIPPV